MFPNIFLDLRNYQHVPNILHTLHTTAMITALKIDELYTMQVKLITFPKRFTNGLIKTPYYILRLKSKIGYEAPYV